MQKNFQEDEDNLNIPGDHLHFNLHVSHLIFSHHDHTSIIFSSPPIINSRDEEDIVVVSNTNGNDILVFVKD